ncbi:hypothetical protein BPOR_1145g00020 [Botrytis porri]|uniref:Transcriptional adapter 2 n=1 Tax=Botrytis porri TaxID=87229 RepID=A0A4Z1KBB4_9HELO|nr:hypothetical protein BPOR_1145g00020 [Botrytis porri]
MGIIRKKTAMRGGEGGVKYVCDMCSADVTNTVRIRCAHSACNEYDLCVQCFSDGKSSSQHQPATHPFRVIEQNSVPIYEPDWGADEELLLLEGCEIYGLGSWADIADHIGGFRTKEEVRDHYKKVYLDSPKFPLPKRASPHDTELMDALPRDEFQARKKARIEKRKEAAKNQPPPQPKKKPTASVPSCHDIQGYMPGRLEFETEYANKAEEAVQLMSFEPGDGVNPTTGKMEPEFELKMTVMNIYNQRLTQRADRKKVIFEHNLLEYRKATALDKKRTKEERDLLTRTKPFARMMNHDDYEEFSKGLIDELNLRLAVSQLQDWRQMRIGDLKSGEKYEQEKAQRIHKAQPMGSMDRERYATSTKNKPPPVVETPSGAAALVAPDLPDSILKSEPNDDKENLVNGNGSLTNGSKQQSPIIKREPIQVQPLSTITPLPLNPSSTPDYHLLTPGEIDLCEKTRLNPKPYLVIKEAILKEALKGDGKLKRKMVKEIARVEGAKGGKIFDFFLHVGWVGKA